MSRSLASVLKTDSLKPLAQILRSKGRKGDTILAHISPKEAARLKREGGSGSINPDTGLPEFFGEDGFDYPTFDVPAAAQQQKDLAAPLLTPGYSALAQANQGRLTATNQQAFQAMQARLAQSQSRSGGVGAVQTAVAEEAALQQALSTQITQALQLIGPGNTLANQAITTNLLGQQQGLQIGINLSQQANQAAMSMYGALAKFVAG